MARKKEWKEGEMILTFNLKKIREPQSKLMQEWLSATIPTFSAAEQFSFEK